MLSKKPEKILRSILSSSSILIQFSCSNILKDVIDDINSKIKPWHNLFASGAGRSIIQTNDGGYIVTGYSDSKNIEPDFGDNLDGRNGKNVYIGYNIVLLLFFFYIYWKYF